MPFPKNTAKTQTVKIPDNKHPRKKLVLVKMLYSSGWKAIIRVKKSMRGKRGRLNIQISQRSRVVKVFMWQLQQKLGGLGSSSSSFRLQSGTSSLLGIVDAWDPSLAMPDYFYFSSAPGGDGM